MLLPTIGTPRHIASSRAIGIASYFEGNRNTSGRADDFVSRFNGDLSQKVNALDNMQALRLGF